MTPENQRKRLEQVKAYGILESGPSMHFDRIAKIARRSLNMPASLISFAGEKYQFWKSSFGLPEEVVPTNVSFSRHCAVLGTALVVPDTSLDARFASNPLVNGPAKMRSYIGCPIKTYAGVSIGAIGLFSTRPRRFSDSDIEVLEDCADLASQAAEAERVARQREAAISDLAHSSAIRKAVFENAAVGIVRFDLQGRFLEANARACQILTYPIESLLQTDWQSLTHVDDLTTNLALRSQDLNGENDEYEIDNRFIGVDGREIHTTIYGRRIDNLTGYEPFFIAIIDDKTDRIRTQKAMKTSDRLINATFNNAAFGIALTSESGFFLSVNPRFCEMLDRPADELVGLQYRNISVVEDVQKNSALRRKAFNNAWRVAGEKRWIRKDGSHLWTRVTVSIIKDDPELGNFSIAIIEDIEQERRDRETRNLLVGELNHRVKNSLAIVQGIISQSIRSAASPEAFAQSIESRINGLARAHDLLTDVEWREVAFSQLIETTMRDGFADLAARLTYTGVDAKLKSQQSITISTMLHELVTNAIKYGAFATDDGRVNATGEVIRENGRDVFRFVWSEHGGPPTSAPEDKKGFGAFVLHRAAQYSLQGQSKATFDDGGLRYELTFPLRT